MLRIGKDEDIFIKSEHSYKLVEGQAKESRVLFTDPSIEQYGLASTRKN